MESKSSLDFFPKIEAKYISAKIGHGNKSLKAIKTKAHTYSPYL